MTAADLTFGRRRSKTDPWRGGRGARTDDPWVGRGSDGQGAAFMRYPVGFRKRRACGSRSHPESPANPEAAAKGQSLQMVAHASRSRQAVDGRPFPGPDAPLMPPKAAVAPIGLSTRNSMEPSGFNCRLTRSSVPVYRMTMRLVLLPQERRLYTVKNCWLISDLYE